MGSKTHFSHLKLISHSSLCFDKIFKNPKIKKYYFYKFQHQPNHQVMLRLSLSLLLLEIYQWLWIQFWLWFQILLDTKSVDIWEIISVKKSK